MRLARGGGRLHAHTGETAPERLSECPTITTFAAKSAVAKPGISRIPFALLTNFILTGESTVKRRILPVSDEQDMTVKEIQAVNR